MAAIEIRPNFRTNGGELSDIMVNGSFAGIMTLLYREGDRLAGSIQLEEETLEAAHKEQVTDALRSYIQSLVYAVEAETCDVIMTHGEYEEIITAQESDDEDALPLDEEWEEDAGSGPDEDLWASLDYELVAVNESRSRIDYHVYDDNGNWLAEAGLRIARGDISGSIRWNVEPADEEIEFVTELLVSDFDENEADTFRLEHRYGDELLESVELAHEDLLESGEAEEFGTESAAFPGGKYDILLARDDGDMLTYEIYSNREGGLPIGTATIDIGQRRLTGFIDFRSQNDAADAAEISAMLMQELDKEKDYDGLNLSLMHRNRLLDELEFENETVH